MLAAILIPEKIALRIGAHCPPFGIARLLLLSAIGAALAAIAAVAAPLLAQNRLRVRHDFDDPEGKLIAYYSSALAFSPLGAPMPARAWSVDAGLEATYIPRLDKARRTAFLDRPEATNLAPVLPRPRVSVTFPGSVRVQASWVPPMRVFDVKANLYSISLSAITGNVASLTIVPRVVASAGRVEGAITCSDDLRNGDQSQRTYFVFVCQGRHSEDRFEPRHLSADVTFTRRVAGFPLVPYAGLGVLREKTAFDIGVIRPDGSRDPDHPILELRATRGYGFAGATWSPLRRTRVSGELYYAPRSLFTARVYGGLHLRGEGDRAP